MHQKNVQNNLQNNVNYELKWLQSESLKPEGVAEIPENILPEFSLYNTGRKRKCMSSKK